MSVTITIKLENSEEFQITLEGEAEVKELKEACAEKSKLAVADQRLIFKGKILKDDNTLSFYKIENGVTVHLVQSSQSKGDSTVATKTEETASTAVEGLGGVPSGMAFGGLGGLPGMGAGGIPDPSKI